MHCTKRFFQRKLELTQGIANAHSFNFAKLFDALRRRWVGLGLASLFVVATQLSGALTPLDHALSGLRAQMTQRPPTGSIVVVEIDSKSLRAAGQWPWPREHLARAIRNLRSAGALLVGFDVDFSSPSNGKDDNALRAAIDASPGMIILPTFVQAGGLEQNKPLADIAHNAVVASVNVPLGADGRVRNYNRGYQHFDQYFGSMASVLANAPYSQTSQFGIDYGIRVDEIDRISFHDVYRGSFDRKRVAGKVILIGASALELGDRFATPIRPSLPGVYVHALAYESLVQGRALVQPSQMLILAFAVGVLMLLWPKPGALDLRAFFVRQGAVLSASLLAPVIIQALTPLSISLGLVIFAQTLCIAISIHHELSRREQEIIRQRAEHLSYVAYHDSENELPNRRAMLDTLAARLRGKAKSAQDVVTVIAVGIERFPILRGAIGFENTNELTQKLALRLSEATGEIAAYHLSTSIIGVAVFAPDESTALANCDEALRRLNTSVTLEDQEIEASIRAGSAQCLANSASPEKLLEQAILALDEARLQNRRHVRYDPARAIDPKIQLALISDVGRGLERGEFTLLYQAKASARDGGITGAEALMRWRHPIHGDISPDRFILVAEETGAIDVLTRWALQRAIEDQKTLRNLGIEKYISVNVSGRCLSDVEFCDYAIQAVQTAKAHLCLEITETAIIEDPLTALSSIAALRSAGIRVSVDDYGSGLSSLAYLKQIAADELKLDKSLIMDVKTSARDRMILKSTIDLAHGLGMSVVAEGVEDEATMALLAGLGCDSIQGYFIARPETLEAFATACRSRTTTAPKQDCAKIG